MQLNLQLKTFKFFILCGLLFTGGHSLTFAQTSNVSDSKYSWDTEAPKDKPAAAQPQAQAQAQAVDSESAPPGEEHDTKDLEQLLKRYNKDAEKVINDSEKLHKEEAGNEINEAEIEDMRPSEDAMKGATANALKKVKADMERKALESQTKKNDYSGAVRLALKPLQTLSEKELLKRMDEQTVNSPMRPYIDQFPNIIVFAVKLIKNEDALPSIAKIAEDKDRLIRFGGFMLATFILGFFLKRLFHREGRSFIKAAFYFLIRMYIMFAVRVYIVYYFFSTELTPAAKVFKATFMS